MITAVLLSVLSAILLAIGFLFAGVAGMTFAFIMALLINAISYWYSDKIVLRMYRAKPAKDKELEDAVGALARDAGIPKPAVYVVPSDVPNAFATGRDPAHSAVAVTQGLRMLSKDEMHGVLAHEISHIKNRDTLVQTVAATIAGAISYVAQIGYWSYFSGNDRERGSPLSLVLIVIFAPLAAMLIRLAISRRREYAADFHGALITKKPHALASALKKISAVSAENPLHGSPATSHMWIVNPFSEDWFVSLFSTHPPLSRRIAKLERMTGREAEQSD